MRRCGVTANMGICLSIRILHYAPLRRKLMRTYRNTQHQGREMVHGSTLGECGVNMSDPVICVRKVLVAEGTHAHW